MWCVHWSAEAWTLCRSPDVYSAYKLKKGQWVPAKLRITSFAVETVDSQGTWPSLHSLIMLTVS